MPPGISLDDDGDTGEPTDIPFELVSANFDATGKFVTPSFTQPVAPVDGVDPSDFRISYAAVGGVCDGSGECVDQTSYSDCSRLTSSLPGRFCSLESLDEFGTDAECFHGVRQRATGIQDER